MSHCVKSVRIRSYFWSTFFRIQSDPLIILKERLKSRAGILLEVSWRKAKSKGINLQISPCLRKAADLRILVLLQKNSITYNFW